MSHFVARGFGHKHNSPAFFKNGVIGSIADVPHSFPGHDNSNNQRARQRNAQNFPLYAAFLKHVRDLPERELGIALPDFTPVYIPTERGKDVLNRLAALVKDAGAVYLATDPDREGEAIAWHIADALRLKNPKRVTYGEITAAAIHAAIKNPRSLDMALVAAQEARRVLDRFCGYLVSGPLSRAAGTRLSAGRVQSPAVRLVVERERAIKGFVSVTHYGAELAFIGGWSAIWLTKPWLQAGQEYLLDSALADRAAALPALTLEECKESESHTAPPAPFTTSSLQQAASNALKFTPKQTMQLAQKLYEGGNITYMRTDSPNLSAEAVAEIRAFCEERGWPLVDAPRTWKSKEGAQEAHGQFAQTQRGILRLSAACRGARQCPAFAGIV